MRAAIPSADTALSLAHIEASFRFDDVRQLAPTYQECGPETAQAILEEAGRFASDLLEPLNLQMDTQGVTLSRGRVLTAPGHREAWTAFVEAGWPTIGHRADHGGQELPLAMCLAVQELFDRACPAFGMLPVPQRSAARLIAAFASDEDSDRHLAELASGELGATICISEAGAGSDVMQMHTHAMPQDDGSWRITGEKCWISFGDHDLTDDIIHCVLARSDPPGTERPEVSLFLVPGGGAQPDSVIVRRLEEKLGLHGSPTCAVGFEAASARLLGVRGRGLAQMFVMITQMRLAVGAMGLGMAGAASDIADAYARERRQGGKPGAPVTITAHRDGQRQLMELAGSTQLLRGLTLNTANIADIALRSKNESERRDYEALLQWLLPILKTCGADAAFNNASGAIQVLGGAGYTADWPVEQILRDARVLAVFEGTSGMQALDIVHRRVLRDSAGLAVFLAIARLDGEGTPLVDALDLLDDAANRLKAGTPDDADGAAAAFLDLAMITALGWVAARFARLQRSVPGHDDMVRTAAYALDRLLPRARLAHSEVCAGAGPLKHFI